MTSKTFPARTVLSLSAIALLITGSLLYAGPLTPPAGPVTSTYKTLTEVEPRTAINAANTPGDADSLFKITQPGSYYLTGNITGVIGKHGVEITVPGVTLDLNGFDLVGIPAMGAFDGVSVIAGGGSGFVNVRNGSIRAWGDCGIEMPNILGAVLTGLVENIQARSNSRHGIRLQGPGSVVARCMSTQNGADGINVASGTTVAHCTANANNGNGIATNHSCDISHCIATNNDLSGFTVNSGCTLTACTATFNLDGFRGLGGVVYTSCNAYRNSGTGIVATEASIVANCVAYLNTLDGISASKSTVRDCTVTSNTANGIRAGSDCKVIGNSCDGNGSTTGDGANILVTGSDTLVEGNRCSDADRGVDVVVAGNIIIRNTCAGNTINWVIVANNVVGPILDRTAPASAAISGNSAPDSTGSTHPNANFTY